MDSQEIGDHLPLREKETWAMFAFLKTRSGVFQKLFDVPLVNPDLYPNDEMKLPSIHDINTFSHSSVMMEDAHLRSKVETIIDFILKPEYQKLHPSYGVIRSESGKYYTMGWSVHLLGYFEPDTEKAGFHGSSGSYPTIGYFLLRLNMMSRSKVAREHPWFKRSFSLLEKYRTEDGLVAFPRQFLSEKRIGYWIGGTRMALEANKRGQKAIACESTFRFLEIAVRVT